VDARISLDHGKPAAFSGVTNWLEIVETVSSLNFGSWRISLR